MCQQLKNYFNVALSSMLFHHICPWMNRLSSPMCIFLDCNAEHKSELAGGFEFAFCSFTKLAKRNICLICRGFRVHSFYSWIFVLLFSLSSGFCKKETQIAWSLYMYPIFLFSCMRSEPISVALWASAVSIPVIFNLHLRLLSHRIVYGS